MLLRKLQQSSLHFCAARCLNWSKKTCDLDGGTTLAKCQAREVFHDNNTLVRPKGIPTPLMLMKDSFLSCFENWIGYADCSNCNCNPVVLLGLLDVCHLKGCETCRNLKAAFASLASQSFCAASSPSAHGH